MTRFNSPPIAPLKGRLVMSQKRRIFQEHWQTIFPGIESVQLVMAGHPEAGVVIAIHRTWA